VANEAAFDFGHILEHNGSAAHRYRLQPAERLKSAFFLDAGSFVFRAFVVLAKAVIGDAIRQFANHLRDTVGNLPVQPGIFPDYAAPGGPNCNSRGSLCVQCFFSKK
jgi:hypothetical protein